jgi:hypothetical protein
MYQLGGRLVLPLVPGHNAKSGAFPITESPKPWPWDELMWCWLGASVPWNRTGRAYSNSEHGEHTEPTRVSHHFI